MKNRLASMDPLKLLMGAIVVIAIAAIVLYIYSGGLSTQKKNVESLSSCKTVGGKCEFQSKCTTTSFEGFGCTGGTAQDKMVCCLLKDKSSLV